MLSLIPATLWKFELYTASINGLNNINRAKGIIKTNEYIKKIRSES